MKKIRIILAALVLIGFHSCDSGNDATNNVLAIYPLTGGAVVVYADQTVDSFTVMANNSWKTSVTADWTSLNSSYISRELSGSKVVSTTCPIYFNINTTGEVRSSVLQVKGTDYTVGRSYLQAYWLNITNPAVNFPTSQTPTEEAQYQGAYFTQTVAKDSTGTKISFQIYAPTATISTSADWITPKEQQFKQGAHTLNLYFSKNTTGKEREAVYTLTTSNGISTKVTILQKGK